MSIQETIAEKRGEITFKQRLKNRVNLEKQKFLRYINYQDLKVFYPYRNLFHTHPFFLRYYKQPPIPYSNYFNSKLCHWISFLPKTTSRDIPYVIEPQDHPLSATGESEPAAALNSIQKAVDTYMSLNCKKILVEGEGQLSLLKKYFPSSVVDKAEIIRLGAIPSNLDLVTKYRGIQRLTFICFASDYKKKAVDLLIKAWLEFSMRHKCELIIACPNIPNTISKFLAVENITVIEKAPLSDMDKKVLLSSSHVMIAPLHVDGGANIIEALEYGLPIITMRSQRSYIREGNGWEVDVPFYFYDEGYGKEWPTWSVFWKLLDDAKEKHAFDITVEGFINIFHEIANAPEKLIGMGKASHNLAINEFSLKTRNERLRKIYSEALL